jgi:hypothetical protein
MQNSLYSLLDSRTVDYDADCAVHGTGDEGRGSSRSDSFSFHHAKRHRVSVDTPPESKQILIQQPEKP